MTVCDPLIVIFGAYGMLGSALMRETHRRGLRHHLHGREVDIADPEAVRQALRLVGHTAVAFVINAAGFTHVDACETDLDKAFASNAWGPRTLASATRFRPLMSFVHVSTGAVFDGCSPSRLDKGGYDEFTQVRPLSAYARSKWAGEELVRQTNPNALIVRLGHLYGPGGKNTLSTARDKLLKQEVYANDEHKIGPTYVDDAARVLLDLATAGVTGTTVHVAPEGSTTAHSFVSRLRDRLPGPGSGKGQVFGQGTAYPDGVGTLGQAYPNGYGSETFYAHDSPRTVAWRAQFQCIRSSVLAHHGVAPIGPWEEGLDRYLQTPASS